MTIIEKEIEYLREYARINNLMLKQTYPLFIAGGYGDISYSDYCIVHAYSGLNGIELEISLN